MSQTTQTFVGAEIDGTTLRVVRLEGRTVVYYEKFRQLNSSAVASVMHQGKSKNTRAVLSWGSSGVAMQRVQAPGVVARKMQPVIRELINRHLPSGSELPGAGLVQSRFDVARPTAMVGAITSETALNLRYELDNSNCGLIVAPFTLNHEGLYLAVRESCAEMTLVRGGIPVSSRQLNCGGASPWPQGDNATQTQSLFSPENVVALRRYLASLAREVHRTIELWERNGDTCPRDLWTFGSGATLPQLPAFLENVGVTVLPAPVSSSLDVSQIPEAERLAAYGSLAAATMQLEYQPFVDVSRYFSRRLSRRLAKQSPSKSLQPFEGVITGDGSRGFASPVFSSSRISQVPRGLAVGLSVVVVAALFATFAWVSAGRTAASLERVIATAQREVKSSKAAAELAARKQSAATQLNSISQFTPPIWSAAVVALLSSLPAEPIVNSVSFNVENGLVSARFIVKIPAEMLDEWQRALATSGASISITELDATENGPVEYAFVFPLGVPFVPFGDA
jgi:hypothetical protein